MMCIQVTHNGVECSVAFLNLILDARGYLQCDITYRNFAAAGARSLGCQLTCFSRPVRSPIRSISRSFSRSNDSGSTLGCDAAACGTEVSDMLETQLRPSDVPDYMRLMRIQTEVAGPYSLRLISEKNKYRGPTATQWPPSTRFFHLSPGPPASSIVSDLVRVCMQSDPPTQMSLALPDTSVQHYQYSNSNLGCSACARCFRAAPSSEALAQSG